jgi:hypothetical protein
MKIKELFKPTGISQSVGGLAILLDRDNCHIVNKTKNEDSVLLHLKRASDGEEGRSYLRVQDQFESVAPQLLNWAFTSNGIMELTLNQLDDFETTLNIEGSEGRLTIKT